MMHLSNLWALSAAGVYVGYAAAAADVEIKMRPLMLPNDGSPFDADVKKDLLVFEPYSPDPTVALNCLEVCPCSSMTNAPDVCDCEYEMTCGGSIPVDFSNSDRISFRWEASSDDTQYISLEGNGRTRIEFQGTADCADGGYQDIRGTDIAFEIDDSGLDDATQKYLYNAEASFLTLGKCDGCDSCEIYTRLQFDPPIEGGPLMMKMKSLTFSASYPQNVLVAGGQEYKWSTTGYSWIRAPGDDGIIEVNGVPSGPPQGAISTSPTKAPTNLSPTSAPVAEGTSEYTPASTGNSAASGCSILLVVWSLMSVILFHC